MIQLLKETSMLPPGCSYFFTMSGNQWDHAIFNSPGGSTLQWSTGWDLMYLAPLVWTTLMIHSIFLIITCCR